MIAFVVVIDTDWLQGETFYFLLTFTAHIYHETFRQIQHVFEVMFGFADHFLLALFEVLFKVFCLQIMEDAV